MRRQEEVSILVESEVLARALAGDDGAREAIYRALSPMVFTLARRMLAGVESAEDVLHETFIEVFTKLSTFRGDKQFSGWVKRIAVNKCLMLLRSSWHAKRAQADPEDCAEHWDRPPTPAQSQLQRALDALPATARAVVLLHDVEGYTHKEIGEMMGRTASFSKSQLARAHERLRQQLEAALGESETRLCVNELKTC